MHYAVHGHTAAELIVARANAEKEHMGLTTWENAPDGKIVKPDVSVAKNYLKQTELEDMGRLVNAVLDMAERMANRHIPMSMEDWAKRIDIILEAGGDAVLTDAGKITAEFAKSFAETEFEKYRIIQDRLFSSDFDRFNTDSLLSLNLTLIHSKQKQPFMIQEYQLRVLPEQAASEQHIKQYVSREKGLDIRTIHAVRVLKRSIDARQRTIFVNLKVQVFINETPTEEEFVRTEYRNVEGKPQVIVVGAGPGGLFAALRLIELGLRPVVVERGKNVRDRKTDLARISREHKVNPESNYSFGEGGAGAYSDGKLYTRSKKRGSVDKILNVFCQHGASTSILIDAHPHIGTDKLPRVIENMRNTIIACGGEVHFQTRMDALLIKDNKVAGIETNTGKTFHGPVILATGHSARDVYRWLYANGVTIEPKGIAVGVRLEHPSMLIDQIQYHNKNGRGKYLPAAEYSFVQQVDGRGVYSFCMCPGGFVVPAASGPHQIVVNGMSPSNRGTKWSNSGMVVELRPEDLLLPDLQLQECETIQGSAEAQTEELIARSGKLPEGSVHTLAVMHFQEKLEQLCWQQGNMRQTAPAQRMADFINRKVSYDLPDTSYSPGLVSSPLHFWMPKFISSRLSRGFQLFGKSSHGFLTNEAVMIAVETRTSAPIRIVRDNETLQHVTVEGLFPCGEGAGYAGGIVSAGIDGERCADAVAAYLQRN